ncbi:MAG: hypothetical protein MUE85_00680 [Microscillaceae bacterium]|nr:hypothetical protein [Microscillaceae bacterium]
MKKFSLILVLSLIFTACGGGKSNSGEELLKKDKEAKNNKPTAPAISKEVLSDIVKSIPSPLEISFLIKDLGIKYDKNVLNSADNTSKYNTGYKQALNLGIYSTDLGYANIYQQTQDALYYLTAVNEMAKGLKIEQFFDFNTIKKLATSSNNLDSLLLVTNTNLEKINERLQEKNQADMTILILTGGWLEALYLTCEVAKKQPNELLNNRIGEQKIILDQLLLLLSFYEESNNIKSLIEDMNELREIYENVKISYEYEESQTKEENGILVVDDKTTSKINFTGKDLDNILNVTKKIRQKIIS